MPAPFDDLSALDRIIHEPARLAILTALAACRSSDFLFLRSLTRLTDGNLSTHLTKLAQAGLVEIEKAPKGKGRHTFVRVTSLGRQSVDRHWHRLEDLRKTARTLRKMRRAPTTQSLLRSTG